MSKKVVLVTGSSGNVGSETVKHLASKYSNKFEIRAATRNPEKCDKLKGVSGINIVKMEMGNKESMDEAFKGIDYLFLVAPQTEDREALTLTTLDAAKQAAVKHIVFVSVYYSNIANTFGKQYKPLEAKLSSLGVPYTTLRIVMFIDNHFGLKNLICNKSTIMFPVDPQKPYTPVAIRDIARAAGAILRDPGLHKNKIYHLASDRFTLGELAKVFSAALEKEIRYIRIPYDVALKAFLDLGFQQWQGDGLMDLYHGIDSGAEWANREDISDFKTITGEDPTTLKDWISMVVPMFKS